MSEPVIYSRGDAVTIHHSAGPRAQNKKQAQGLHKAYQRLHIQEFGTTGHRRGDIGYHFSMDDLGRFYCLRPYSAKGTHVGNWNTGNIGIMVHGNYVHDNLTTAQKESLKWLFQGGFHRLFKETEAGIHIVRGHQEWPGHGTNACPGTHLMRHLAWLRNTQTY
jgi:hypothetical protein